MLDVVLVRLLKYNKLDVDGPVLPRKRKVPRRYEEGSAEPEFFNVCKQFYCQRYYEALDLIVNAIQARFDQPGFKMYRNLQDHLPKLSRVTIIGNASTMSFHCIMTI